MQGFNLGMWLCGKGCLKCKVIKCSCGHIAEVVYNAMFEYLMSRNSNC